MPLDYEVFFQKLPSPCAVLSPEFTILAVNEAFVRVSMHVKETLIGRGIFDVFPGNPDVHDVQGAQNLRASLERVKQDCVPDALPVQRYDIPDPAKPGAFIERYWSPLNTPVCDEQGRLQCIIHLAEDVTEIVRLGQKQAERVRIAEAVVEEEHQRLKESHIALEASNEELEAFCYSVAHDLRAPLRAIQGFSQALLEDHAAQLDAQGLDYLGRASGAALRMSALIDDLLTLSRISRSPLARSHVDLSALARSVGEEMAARSAQDANGRRVALTISDDAHTTGDEKLLRIALENLLGNAWKFTSKAADPRVEFGIEIIDGMRAFFVRDNGAGFDEAYAARLFSPFQRLHAEKEFPGTGIGLATVQRIMRRHGGHVWARGVVNRGATFYFMLPD